MDYISGIRGSTREKYHPIVKHLLTYYYQAETEIPEAQTIRFIYSVESEGNIYTKLDRNVIIYINQAKNNGDMYSHMLQYNLRNLTEELVDFMDMMVTIEKGVDIPQLEHSKTPLHRVIRYCTGQVAKAVEVLLKRDFNYQVMNEYGIYPIHYASGLAGGHDTWDVTDGRLGALKILLQHPGIDVNVESEGINQVSPLHCSVIAATNSSENAEKAVELLLEHGARVDKQNDLGLQVVHYYFGAYKPNVINPATENILKILVSKGADVNATGGWNRHTPLHFGVSNISTSVKPLEVLLQFKADVNAQNGEGMTPLHFACNKLSWILSRPPEVSVKILKMLVEHGADLNMEDSKSRTALHYAVTSGIPKLADILCQKGIDWNVYDIDGKKAIQLVTDISPEACIIREYMEKGKPQKHLQQEQDNELPQETLLFYKSCRLVALSIGQSWRMLFRQLEPHENPQKTEAMVRELEEKYRGQLQEPAYQALLHWRESRGETAANTSVLITALRKCHLVAIAEDIEKLTSPKCQSAA